jgi:hypothetical protein
MLKVPAVERWKLLKYGVLKYKQLKENDIEMQQVVGHVAASLGDEIFLPKHYLYSCL